MNTTAITAATHDILHLYKLDTTFFKNLLANHSWNNYSEFKETVARSITTLSYDEAKKVIDSLDYFKQIDTLSPLKNHKNP